VQRSQDQPTADQVGKGRCLLGDRGNLTEERPRFLVEQWVCPSPAMTGGQRTGYIGGSIDVGEGGQPPPPPSLGNYSGKFEHIWNLKMKTCFLVVFF